MAIWTIEKKRIANDLRCMKRVCSCQCAGKPGYQSAMVDGWTTGAPFGPPCAYHRRWRRWASSCVRDDMVHAGRVREDVAKFSARLFLGTHRQRQDCKVEAEGEGREGGDEK